MTEALLFKVVLFAPLAGILACALFSSGLSAILSRIASLVAFIATLPFLSTVDAQTVLPVALIEKTWLPGVPVDFALGISGFGLPFFVFGQAIACATVWTYHPQRTSAGTASLLFFQSALAVAFTSLDLILFCAAIETVVLALLFNVQMADPKKAGRALAFSLAASALVLSSAVVLGALHLEQFQTFSTRLAALRELNFGTEVVVGDWTFDRILFSMAVVGTLLRAHTVPAHLGLEAAASGRSSIGLLAWIGVSGLLAGYTWLQWILPVFPQAAAAASSTLSTLLIFSSLYCALTAWVTEDLSRWIARIAVAQTSFALLGLVVLSPASAQGSLLLLLAAPMGSFGLLWVAQHLERGLETRQLHDIGSLLPVAPRLGIAWALLCAITLGFPATGTFSAWVLVLGSLFQSHPALGALAAIAVIVLVLSAVRVCLVLLFGHSPHQGIRAVPDLSWIGLSAVIVASALSAIVGIHPELVRDRTEPALRTLWKVPLEADTRTVPKGRAS